MSTKAGEVHSLCSLQGVEMLHVKIEAQVVTQGCSNTPRSGNTGGYKYKTHPTGLFTNRH